MSGLDGSAADLAWTLGLVLCRVLPVTLIAPYLGGRFVPGTARWGLGLVLGAALLPVVPLAQLPPTLGALATVEVATAVVGELLLGAAVGFIAALVVYAALMAGALIDAVRGGRDPARPAVLGGDASGPTPTLLGLLTIVVFLALDGHQLIVRALAGSFEAIAPGRVAPTVGQLLLAADQLVVLMGRMIALAAVVSLPVLLAGLLVTLVLGVASRVAPRLHAFFLALPLRSLAALFVLAISLAVAVDVLVGELGQSGGWIRRLVETVGG